MSVAVSARSRANTEGGLEMPKDNVNPKSRSDEGRDPPKYTFRRPREEEEISLTEVLGGLLQRLKSLDNERTDIEENIYQLGEEAEKEAEDLEKELSSARALFSEFIDYFSSSQKASLCSYPPSLTIRYTEWEDFKTQSTNAKLVSFLVEEKEKVFQVYALKEGRVLAYSGEFPQYSKLLKSWLSRELSTQKEKIVEGVLAIG